METDSQKQPSEVQRPEEGQDAYAAELAEVKRWTARIRRAKTKFDNEYKRMRKNMEFVYGLQWDDQKNLVDEDRYIANLTLPAIENKVATLYARNPQAAATRRKRLDFVLWDGTVEALTNAMMQIQAGATVGLPNLPALALMQDFMMGRQRQALVDKVCKTLEYVYRYQIDTAKPRFKEQMKELVRRVCTCGVGYVRPIFVRKGGSFLSSVEQPHTLTDRAKLAARIASKAEDGKVRPDEAEMVELQSIAKSAVASVVTNDEMELDEHIEFDFPPSTSVIPDEVCRSLKDFSGARWLVIEHLLPVDEVNTFYGFTGEDEIKPGGELREYTEDGQVQEQKNAETQGNDKPDPQRRCVVAVLEVFDYTTKTTFVLVDGYKRFVSPPEPLEVPVSGFWPLVALTFNDVEHDRSAKGGLFPPSDVDLMRNAQKEWNRTREANRDQRNANAPTYLVRKGMLSDDDKERLRTRQPNEVVELEQLPSDVTPDQAIKVLQVAPIDRSLYETQSYEQDLMLAGRTQQANIGPAQPDVTATVGTIAEQSRMTASSSNVDDLDEFLSALASMCAELLLRGMSPDTVQRIAGRGAVWPMLDREDFVNQIELTVKAASSGRPNKAIDIANYQTIAPFLLQAGANPIAVIEEGVRRLDDNLDVSAFFPVPGAMPPAVPPQQSAPSGPGRPQRVPGQKPQQQLPTRAPVLSTSVGP